MYFPYPARRFQSGLATKKRTIGQGSCHCFLAIHSVFRFSNGSIVQCGMYPLALYQVPVQYIGGYRKSCLPSAFKQQTRSYLFVRSYVVSPVYIRQGFRCTSFGPPYGLPDKTSRLFFIGSKPYSYFFLPPPHRIDKKKKGSGIRLRMRFRALPMWLSTVCSEMHSIRAISL